MEIDSAYLEVLYFTYNEDYEIIIYGKEYIPIEYNGYLIYAPEKTNKPIDQTTIDLEFIKKLAKIAPSKIPRFLS